MRRDYFSLTPIDTAWVDTDDDPTMPTLEIIYEGPATALSSAVAIDDDTSLAAADVDVVFRLQSSIEDPDGVGVLGLFNRLTGDVLFELNTSAEPLVEFLRAARRFGEQTSDPDALYRLRLAVDDETIATLEKRTFLVYHRDGSLLQQHSLIPSGIQL